MVPTIDTLRYQYLISALLYDGKPVLLTGTIGTGKTSSAHSVLQMFDPARYSVCVVNMSAQTSSLNLQEAIEARLEKRTKGVFVPIGNKNMITFLDDMNMPAKETYGSQPPLELLRQLLDYGFWYNRQYQTRTYVMVTTCVFPVLFYRHCVVANERFGCDGSSRRWKECYY